MIKSDQRFVLQSSSEEGNGLINNCEQGFALKDSSEDGNGLKVNSEEGLGPPHPLTPLCNSISHLHLRKSLTYRSSPGKLVHQFIYHWTIRVTYCG